MNNPYEIPKWEDATICTKCKHWCVAGVMTQTDEGDILCPECTTAHTCFHCGIVTSDIEKQVIENGRIVRSCPECKDADTDPTPYVMDMQTYAAKLLGY